LIHPDHLCTLCVADRLEAKTNQSSLPPSIPNS
jgi:hypothetical protein